MPILSDKNKEKLRRWAGLRIPKYGALLAAFGVLGGAVAFTGSVMRLVTITDTDGETESIVTGAQDMEDVLNQAHFSPAGQDDLVTVSETEDGDTVTVYRAYTVTLTADGDTKDVAVTGGTVADLLAGQNVELGENDRVEPALDTETTEGMNVTVYRVEYKDYTVREVVPMETEMVETSLFYRCQSFTMDLQDGCDGLADVSYRETYVDGVLTDTAETGRETLEEMQPTITKCYGEKVPVSSYVGPEIVDGKPAEGIATTYTSQRATGYSASATAKGSSGRWLNYGTVAINPNIIPYGSLMYITSDDGRFVYGYAYAADTGTAMMAGTAFIDLYYETYTESVKNAVIPVTIYVLDDETAAKYKETNDAIRDADPMVGK